ncbi:8-amino-7-oxononanoate synthase, putative [Ricinus communis]|uniref:8-amino-7-oxononanoate synthase, putative n=1 Tax=Ricinus communis TaxID=3988 RepID=B9RB57_RICCO|nr:8-amino-7-oxononanoate synthase, putative [Ricinus communis]
MENDYLKEITTLLVSSSFSPFMITEIMPEEMTKMKELMPVFINLRMGQKNEEEEEKERAGGGEKNGDEIVSGNGVMGHYVEQSKKLLLFSGNDYLGLSAHPTIGKAAAKAAQEHGMGPRGSALICGYTNYHRLLESSLANLKKKEDCLLCPTGFAANMAVMVALGNISSLLASAEIPLKKEKIAIFSDTLNHASIIDGIRLAERQQNVEVHVYKHCDMSHLSSLLSNCALKKKVVVTDSLFSMDGDFAPMAELVKLRKRHGFLLVIDDAHGTFICGKNGGGVAEEFNCEKDVDICVGTLSKAAGCHGGFIACSKQLKKLIQSRGRSFIFSTASPVPVAAAAHAAVIVATKEVWRRRAVWNRVQEFQALTGIPITSPIISLVVGSEEKALKASRFPLFPHPCFLFKCYLHVIVATAAIALTLIIIMDQATSDSECNSHSRRFEGTDSSTVPLHQLSGDRQPQLQWIRKTLDLNLGSSSYQFLKND